MAKRRKVLGVTAGLVGGLLLVGLAVYLVVVGLDKADKISSVIGALGGLIGVGVGLFELTRGRSTPVHPASSGPSISNSITGEVSGNVVQAGSIEGNIDMQQND